MAKPKAFYVKISDGIEIPYEEGLLDGDINKNHLMYMANALLQERGKLQPGLDPTRVMYEFYVRHEFDAGTNTIPPQTQL